MGKEGPRGNEVWFVKKGLMEEGSKSVAFVLWSCFNPLDSQDKIAS